MRARKFMEEPALKKQRKNHGQRAAQGKELPREFDCIAQAHTTPEGQWPNSRSAILAV
jgi:hypothetical protein